MYPRRGHLCRTPHFVAKISLTYKTEILIVHPWISNVLSNPPEESLELRQYTDPAEIDFISLIAPTTMMSGSKQLRPGAHGFLYYISVTGVTGTQKPEIADTKKDMARIRRVSGLPVAVGFGISTPQQAGEIAPLADGVVVGSAFVRMIEENSRRDDLVSLVAGYAGEIKKSL